MKNCLCYTPEKGLFKDWKIDDSNVEGCIFIEYDDVKEKRVVCEIPEEQFQIVFYTKFGNYIHRSWHYATISYQGNQIMSLDPSTFRFLGIRGIYNFHVMPEDWERLFDIIIDVWNRRDHINNDINIYTYIRELSKFLDLNSIKISSTIQDEKAVTWDDSYSILKLACEYISEFVLALRGSQISTESVYEATDDLCIKLLRKYKENINKTTEEGNTNQTEKLSKHIADIFSYMGYREHANDFVDILICPLKK